MPSGNGTERCPHRHHRLDKAAVVAAAAAATCRFCPHCHHLRQLAIRERQVRSTEMDNAAEPQNTNGSFSTNPSESSDGSMSSSDGTSSAESEGSQSSSRTGRRGNRVDGPNGHSEDGTTDLDPSPQITASPTAATQSANWTMFGKDLLHNAYVPERFTYPLKLNWKFVTKQTADYPTSPVIADGIMYFCTNTRLYAMNAETGSLYWKYPTDIPIPSRITEPPCVGEDLIYFGSGDGKLMAVRKKDGVLVWTFATKGPISSAPVLSGDTLFNRIGRPQALHP